MNKDTAKDYLPLVQALAEGKTIEYRDSDDAWIDCELPTFNQHPSRYRIKPEPKWIRLGLFEQGTIVVEDCESEKRCARNPIFIRWLTDRIEYTLPEGDA